MSKEQDERLYLVPAEARPILAQIHEQGLLTALKPYEDRLSRIKRDFEADKYRPADMPEDESSEADDHAGELEWLWEKLEEQAALAILKMQKALAAYDAEVAKYQAKDAA